MQKRAVELLNAIWVNVDFENMQKSRRMNFQNEFVTKVRGCAISSATLENFIEALCKKLNIVSFVKEQTTIHEITELSAIDKNEILTIIRTQLIRVINDLMIMRDEISEKRKAKITPVDSSSTMKPSTKKSSINIDIIAD